METKKYLKLQYYRGLFDIKQADFAELIGCKVSNYSLKENGNVGFEIKEACKVRDALNKHCKKHGRKLLTIDDIFFD